MKKLLNVPAQTYFWCLTICTIYFIVMILAGLPDWDGAMRGFVMVLVFSGSMGVLLLGLRRIYRPVNDLQRRLQQESPQSLHQEPLTNTGDGEWWPELILPIQRLIDDYTLYLQSYHEHSARADQYLVRLRQWLDQQAAIAAKQKHLFQEFRVLMDDWSKWLPTLLKQMDELQELNRKQNEYGQYSQDLILAAEEQFSLVQHQTDFRRRLQEELAGKIQFITILNKRIHTLTGQTKLIAFNAAIEAATTGDTGRRFNVVASDIRKLASIVETSNNDMREVVNDIQALFHELQEQLDKEDLPYNQIRSAWSQLTLMMGETVKIVKTIDMVFNQWIQNLHHQQKQIENMQLTFQEMQSAHQQFQQIHKQIKDNLHRRPGSSESAVSSIHRNSL